MVELRLLGKQKNTCTPRGSLCACSSTCVEEVALFWHLGDSDVDCKRRRYNQQDDGGSPVHPRTGVG